MLAARRLLDAVLFSSLWLALAAAAQTMATLRLWPTATGLPGWRVAALVGAATLFVYNLDAVLPYKQRQPAGTSGRKAWQQRHYRLLLAVAVAAALAGVYFGLADGWWRYTHGLLPLAILALAYSWPLWPWRGQPRALREVPLLKVFLIAAVWTAVTVGLPALARHQSLASAAGLLAQRFCLVAALAIVFDIRDVSRDQAADLHTWPTVLGVAGAKAVSLALLLAAVAVGLARGAAPLAVLAPAGLAAAVILTAQESRDDYFFAFLTDGVLLVQAVAYFL